MGINEAKKARKISKHLGINHKIESLRGEKIKTIIDDHFSAFSEPFSDYSSIPTYILCERASKYYKVLLSGDGADELFWGYPRFLSVIDYKYWFMYPRYLRMKWAGILRRLNKKVSSCIEYDSIQDWVFDRQSPIWISQFKRLMPQSRNSFFTQRLYNIPNSVKTSRELLIWLRKMSFMGIYKEFCLKLIGPQWHMVLR